MLGLEDKRFSINKCLGLGFSVKCNPKLRIRRAKTTNDLNNNHAKNFFTKVKIALVESVILAGYTTFLSLLGDMGFVLASREIAQILADNPILLVIQILLVFGSTFFTKLVVKLNLKDDPYY